MRRGAPVYGADTATVLAEIGYDESDEGQERDSDGELDKRNSFSCLSLTTAIVVVIHLFSTRFWHCRVHGGCTVARMEMYRFFLRIPR